MLSYVKNEENSNGILFVSTCYYSNKGGERKPGLVLENLMESNHA